MSDFSRRTFLQASAAAAPALLPAQTSSDSLRVAVIGVGNRGAYLLKQASKLPNVRFVALADVDPEALRKAEEFAAGAGHKTKTYADFRRMLDENRDIDAVLIATPVDTHKAIALATLEVGKHVYLEKPVAHTPEDVRMVTQAAKSAKGILQLGFQLRHDPARKASIEQIHKGALGKLLFMQGYRHTGDLPRSTAWYFDRVRSGDNIVEQACHIIDLFVWTVGKPPLRAFGSGGVNLYKNEPPGRTTMDNYTVIYEFPDDVRLTFSHIYFDPAGFSGIHERVWGEKGAIELPDATLFERETKNRTKLEVPDAGRDSTEMSLAAFMDNARGRKTPLNNIDSGALSTLVAMMGRKAIYEKRVVTWAEMQKKG